MNTTTIGGREWALPAVGELAGDVLDDDGGGVDRTARPELPAVPPAHAAQTAAIPQRMSAAAFRTAGSVAGGH
jgi:hypothetical protein